jgi:hypothetical protein
VAFQSSPVKHSLPFMSALSPKTAATLRGVPASYAAATEDSRSAGPFLNPER